MRAGQLVSNTGARRQRGVEEVMAQATEELLDDDDGKRAAHGRQPQRRRGGQVQAQQQAGHHRGQVVHGDFLSGQLLPQGFRNHRGRDRDGQYPGRPKAKQVQTGRRCGKQRDEDIEHNSLRVLAREDMRAGRKAKFHPYDLLAASCSLAIFSEATSQRRAGHT